MIMKLGNPLIIAPFFLQRGIAFSYKMLQVAGKNGLLDWVSYLTTYGVQYEPDDFLVYCASSSHYRILTWYLSPPFNLLVFTFIFLPTTTHSLALPISFLDSHDINCPVALYYQTIIPGSGESTTLILQYLFGKLLLWKVTSESAGSFSKRFALMESEPIKSRSITWLSSETI